MDFRRLNQATKMVRAWMPNAQLLLKQCGDARWFSSMDLTKGFHHISIRPEDRHKTAFLCRQGQMQWRRMVMGLHSAPQVFCQMMEVIFGELIPEVLLAYIDDLLAKTRSWEDHVVALRNVFTLVRKHRLHLEPSKCHLGYRRVVFLGFVVSEDGVEADPDKIAAVEAWPVPTDVKGVRTFLGMASFYRQFVPQFSAVAAPLRALLKGGAVWVWDAECQASFDELKRRLTAPPILSHYQSGKELRLCTDACVHGLGAVLEQDQGEGGTSDWKVLGYASKSVDNAQYNYSVTELELLAVRWATEFYKAFLQGVDFTLVTDHSALQWLVDLKNPIGRNMRWILFLQGFKFVVKHRPGDKLGHADALSRMIGSRPGTSDVNEDEADDDASTEPWRPRVEYDKGCPACRWKRLSQREHLICAGLLAHQADMAEDGGAADPQVSTYRGIHTVLPASFQPTSHCPETVCDGDEDWNPSPPQLSGPDLQLSMAVIAESGRKNTDNLVPELAGLQSDDPATAPYLQAAQAGRSEHQGVQICLGTQGVVCRVDGIHLSIILPTPLRRAVVEYVHCSPAETAHGGITKVLQRLRRIVWWPKMAEDVRAVVVACRDCQTRKRHHRSRRPTMVARRRVCEPFERVVIDLVGPLTASQGYVYILMVIDTLTRYLFAYPLKSPSAEEVCAALRDGFFNDHSVPAVILSDNGSHFANEIMATMCRIGGIDKRWSSPYHPQTNGLAERVIGTVKEKLSLNVNEASTDWVHRLPSIVSSYRKSFHEGIGMSPHMALFGHQPRSWLDRLLVQTDWDRASTATSKHMKELVRELRDELESWWSLLEDRYEEQMKRLNGRRPSPQSFEVGDLVMVDAHRFARDPKAFKHRFVGPGKVLTVGRQDYEVNLPGAGKPRRFNQDDLKPYYPERLLDAQKAMFQVYRTLYPEAAARQEIQDEDVYEVSAILNHRVRESRRGAGIPEVFIDWAGMPESERSWIPVSDLITRDLLDDYGQLHAVEVDDTSTWPRIGYRRPRKTKKPRKKPTPAPKEEVPVTVPKGVRRSERLKARVAGK